MKSRTILLAVAVSTLVIGAAVAGEGARFGSDSAGPGTALAGGCRFALRSGITEDLRSVYTCRPAEMVARRDYIRM